MDQYKAVVSFRQTAAPRETSKMASVRLLILLVAAMCFCGNVFAQETTNTSEDKYSDTVKQVSYICNHIIDLLTEIEQTMK